MAWRCGSLTNEGLIDNLCRAGIVRSKRVVDAMKSTDRAKYMAESDHAVAYADSPQPIGFNQTISAPHMHAYALELADEVIERVAHPKILDVGSGSGYLSVCLARMVEDKGGNVFAIEKIEDLVKFATSNVEAADKDLLENSVLKMLCVDGWKGLPEQAPFHFIHVGAAADEIPSALQEQLAVGGKMVIPVGNMGSVQYLTEIHRTNQGCTQRKLMGVNYVPLVRDETYQS